MTPATTPDPAPASPTGEQAQALLAECFRLYRGKLVDIARASVEMAGDLFEGNAFVQEKDVDDFKAKRGEWVKRFDRVLAELYERRIGGRAAQGPSSGLRRVARVPQGADGVRPGEAGGAGGGDRVPAAAHPPRARRAGPARRRAAERRAAGATSTTRSRPAYILDAIGVSARAVYPNPRIWRAFMERAVADLTPAANKVYITLNRFLADHGVLPEIKAALRARSDLRPADDKDLIPTFSKMLRDAGPTLPADLEVPQLGAGAGTSAFDFEGAAARVELLGALVPSALLPNASGAPGAEPVAGPACRPPRARLERARRSGPGHRAARGRRRSDVRGDRSADGARHVDAAVRHAGTLAAHRPAGRARAVAPRCPTGTRARGGAAQPDPAHPRRGGGPDRQSDGSHHDGRDRAPVRLHLPRPVDPRRDAAHLQPAAGAGRSRRRCSIARSSRTARTPRGGCSTTSPRRRSAPRTTRTTRTPSRGTRAPSSSASAATSRSTSASSPRRDLELAAFIEAERNATEAAVEARRRAGARDRGARGGPRGGARADPRQAGRPRPAVRGARVRRDDVDRLPHQAAARAGGGVRRVGRGRGHARRPAVEHRGEGAHGAEGPAHQDDPRPGARAAQGLRRGGRAGRQVARPSSTRCIRCTSPRSSHRPPRLRRARRTSASPRRTPSPRGASTAAGPC